MFNKIVHGNVAIEFPTYFDRPRITFVTCTFAGPANSVGVGGGGGV